MNSNDRVSDERLAALIQYGPPWGRWPERELSSILAELQQRRSQDEPSRQCPHGATDQEVCPECMGAPSDNPDDELARNCAMKGCGNPIAAGCIALCEEHLALDDSVTRP